MQNRRVAAAFNRWLVPLAEGAPRIQSIAQLPDGSVRLEHSGATNEPWSLDYAVLRPGRFDAKIYIRLPDPPARRRILELNSKGMPLAPDVDLDDLTARLEGMSGADIAHLCHKTAEAVFRESVETRTERPIARADFIAALADMRPSVAPADLKRFETWSVQ